MAPGRAVHVLLAYSLYMLAIVNIPTRAACFDNFIILYNNFAIEKKKESQN